MPPRWIKTRRGIKNSPSGLRTDMGGAILLMTVTRGAHFEIKVDGIVRTHRDERDTAIEAARFIQQRSPGVKIAVTDLRDGSAVEWSK
jgi:hypothetical protein